MKNDPTVVKVTIDVANAKEAQILLESLCEKLKEAKTLAGELASLTLGISLMD